MRAGRIAWQPDGIRKPGGRSGGARVPAALLAAALLAAWPVVVLGDEPGPRALLVAARETTLVAQMVGVVRTLGGELGGAFRQGAVLVRFDCAEQRARLGIAKAELVSAEEQHAAKKRLQGLSAAGEVEVSLAAAAVARARAQIDLGNAQVAQCTVVAPFDGRISRLHVREFQGVSIGEPLLDIVSSGPLRVRLNAPSHWLGWLRRGTRFEVHIDETGRRYPATVSAINARVDPASQTIELEGRISEDFPGLLAGMSGNAYFVAPTR
ncbi:MAG: efflux RND transporter periplasmic adaptor subunit [Burkholderiaceae bacterium]|nr:efflux RND transporter periplasmic adaptor subunit [Burkholderiaceae bacterium]